MLPAIVTSQIIDSRTGKSPAQRQEQILRKVDHKQGEANGVFHRSLFDAHEILQTEVLLSLSDTHRCDSPPRCGYKSAAPRANGHSRGGLHISDADAFAFARQSAAERVWRCNASWR